MLTNRGICISGCALLILLSVGLSEELFHPFSFLSQGANKMVEKPRESDDEFDPDDATSTDDEETIAQEETLDSGDSSKNKDLEKEEIDALKRESEIPLEDLLDDLPPEYFENLGKADEVDGQLQIIFLVAK